MRKGRSEWYKNLRREYHFRCFSNSFRDAIIELNQGIRVQRVICVKAPKIPLITNPLKKNSLFFRPSCLIIKLCQDPDKDKERIFCFLDSKCRDQWMNRITMVRYYKLYWLLAATLSEESGQRKKWEKEGKGKGG